MYTPEVYQLHWPITGEDGQKKSAVTLHLISHGEHAKAVADEPDERTAFARFAQLSCGLNEKEVQQLKVPDWNYLCQQLSSMVTKESAYFFAKLDTAYEPDIPQLLLPILGDNGQTISSIQLTMPTVATTDVMLAQTDDEQKSRFITASCSGLSPSELDRLSAPDWNALQGRIHDFLHKTADYFRPQILSNSPM
ncbi:phage tail assembly protein [Algicola sagamiensis]|uniref:phage tail assembly protein n=1 Tax=Algicola sagamiensis TaxID=163869 RepID=UPI000362A9CF|nr:phage tail assembly protein [Algicola sagamiensis]